MGILSGNPKDEPLHYGEVFSIWEASMMAKGSISCYEAYMYHAGDKELKKLIQDFLDQARLEVKECDELLTDNGISPSPMLAERPAAELEDIPPGARFTDPEIAAKLAADNALGLVSCSKTMGLSIREDVGALFAKYHVTKTALGLRVLRMNKEKGWLVPPPLVAKQPE
ncbi:DUF3231 family protein [Paenibacillus campinasensis]|uniref:DUF3231 family protein n=1 Tax=Paenibacillus campinasensis TaxID=66347 RepID=A0A268EVJ1_9BACL|nr:DUF3231 family protein [Paenibacillus campinasensis]MUG67852.1 DUF3231 family protein [Paenibacillus campinasensis]PAD77138.1 hypothetical protein CHH67_10535 [Paenibacillus campinasensis]